MSFTRTLPWLLLSYVILLPGARSTAQEPEGTLETEKGRGRLFDGYDPYLELTHAEHVPPARRGEKELVRLRFNVVPEIPEGTVFSFTLEYGGLDYVTVDYTFKGPGREGLVLEWKPEIKLAEGEYFLRSRMHLQKQTPTVRALMERNPKRFPPHTEPWPWLYMAGEPWIAVDSPLKDPEQKKRLWSAYEAFIAELEAGLSEFTAEMGAFRSEEDPSVGGTFDAGKVKEYAFQWRAKHAETVAKILEFQVKEPALFAGSRSAFSSLRDLGRMVAKHARDQLKEVLAKHGDKAPDLHKEWPARDYPFRVDQEMLERQKQRILTLIDHPQAGQASKESNSKEGAPARPAPPASQPPPPSQLSPPDLPVQEPLKPAGSTPSGP